MPAIDETRLCDDLQVELRKLHPSADLYLELHDGAQRLLVWMKPRGQEKRVKIAEILWRSLTQGDLRTLTAQVNSLIASDIEERLR